MYGFFVYVYVVEYHITGMEQSFELSFTPNNAHNREPTFKHLPMKNLRTKVFSKLTLIFYRESLSLRNIIRPKFGITDLKLR